MWRVSDTRPDGLIWGGRIFCNSGSCRKQRNRFKRLGRTSIPRDMGGRKDGCVGQLLEAIPLWQREHHQQLLHQHVLLHRVKGEGEASIAELRVLRLAQEA